MATKPKILTPREPLVDSTGNVTRSWWRALNDLFTNSGTLASDLVVDGSSILTAATVTSGGTISVVDIPGGSLIGNSGTTAGQPGTLAVDPSLSLNGGTLAVAPLPPGTLSGNAGVTAAPPSAIQIGQGLSLSAGTLASDGSTDVLAYLARDRAAEIQAVNRKADDALTIALLMSPAPATQSAAQQTAAIFAPLVNGDLPGPVLVADPFGQCVMAQVQ
jgi:hypothetical protein